MNMLMQSCLKFGLTNIANQRTAVRRENQTADAAEAAETRRLAVIASKDDFFLRAKASGYDFGKDPDPDGIWRSKYPK